MFQIPVRYQDVAVFFTREEWNYIEENEELYKKEILSDPNESKEDQIEDFIGDPGIGCISVLLLCRIV